jgi:hypothetical protein
MIDLTTIKLKALFTVVVFTANLFAVCHCSEGTPVTGASKHSCCEAKQGGSNETCAKHPCNPKDGCCESKAEFNSLDRQTCEKLDLNRMITVTLPDDFIKTIHLAQDPNAKRALHQDQLLYYSPPDLQTLYQRFLI